MKTPRSKAPWVLWETTAAAPENTITARCTRCGEVLHLKLPLRLDSVVALTRAFVNVHARCPPRVNDPAPYVPTFPNF